MVNSTAEYIVHWDIKKVPPLAVLEGMSGELEEPRSISKHELIKKNWGINSNPFSLYTISINSDTTD